MPLDPHAIRRQFHFFRTHGDAVYLDSASTTQKPDCTLHAMAGCWSCAANVGRGSHALAAAATRQVADVRRRAAAFLGAASPEDVVFTSGATHGLNLVALAWGAANLRDGDEVLYCPHDHKAAVLPWELLRETLARGGTRIHLVPFRLGLGGEGDVNDLASKVTDRTRVVCLTHVHNVYGARTTVERVRDVVGPSAVITLDAAQSVGHLPVDVKTLGTDFLSCSGHKMFAATGSGMLWVHPRRHAELRAPIVGGTQEGLGGAAGTLEAGTPNVAGILSLGAAITFIESLGLEAIDERLGLLTDELILGLRTVPGLEILPAGETCDCTVDHGIVAFRLRDMGATDVAFALDQRGICVRGGTHCRARADEEAVRVSAHVYTTSEEIDSCVRALRDIAG